MTFIAHEFLCSSGKDSIPGWSTWIPRPENAPRFFVSRYPDLRGGGSLAIAGGSNYSGQGCWQAEIKGIVPNAFYKLVAMLHTELVPYPRQQAYATMTWENASADPVGRREYTIEGDIRDGWRLNSGTFKAPAEAVSGRIELFLSGSPQGTVYWDNISLTRVPPPEPRVVRIGAIHCYPEGVTRTSRSESVEAYLPMLEKAGEQGCDIVCIGESIDMAGSTRNGASLEGVDLDPPAPIPGPLSDLLSGIAIKHGMYIVGSLTEQDGEAIYNTAVLIDRRGRVAGKYRKTSLPREEILLGVTPGNDFPVFDTDFGRIGMMICWDQQYVLPARSLAVRGAEIIFMPIWSGDPILTKARAIENQVYMVTSSYGSSDNPPSAVYDPWGRIIARAEENFSVAHVDIDLNKKVLDPDGWLGDMKARLHRERRADIIVPELLR